jgi:hypothetical protein
MNIVYTIHAKKQMMKRKIHEVWVEETIKWPDQTIINGNKIEAIRRVTKHPLKVIYVREERYLKIITLYLLK